MNRQKTTRLKSLFLVLLFLLSLLPIVRGQTLKVKGINYIPEIEVLFGQGIQAYQRADYHKAEEIFSNLISRYPPHQRLTIAYVMLGKSYYQQGKFQQTIRKIDELLKKYPNSNYRFYAKYLKGLCLYQQKKFVPSLTEFLYVADQVAEGNLAEKSKNLALKIIENNVTTPDLKRLSDSCAGEISSAIVAIKLASSYINIGRRAEAFTLLQNFIKRHPKNPYNQQIKQLLSRTDIVIPKGIVKVGIILPISGEYSEQARAVLAGIRYAQKKWNEKAEVQIELVIKDSQGDIVRTVEATRELLQDNGVLAIIGELDRDKTVAISAAINNYNMPLIAPTTSGVNVTKLNNYTFQLNPDLGSRGEKLAEYAVKKMNLKTFATLAPMDDYGRQMADAFTATVEKLGGSVLTQKWYFPGTKDLGRQMKSIREMGFNMMNRDSLIHYYTKGMSPIQKRRFDLETIPVTSIDGVFIPCATEEIQYIAPQFAFVNIRTQLFGGENWYELDELRKVQQYVDGVIFCSGYFKDETNPDFIRFQKDFTKIMKRKPDVMELYGYDAMQVFEGAVSKNHLTREEVANFLSNLKNLSGIRGKISIDTETGINRAMRLITYKNGRFSLIETGQ
ncbi:MAG: ABC transporter substrate-binding protein [Calditrichaeota bacterium]|nr:ABC transporter substrate-binding protein [Calditrichota bacterium]